MRKELLRFDGTVERDRAIDAWMKEHAGELGAIAHQWCEVMRKCGTRSGSFCMTAVGCVFGRCALRVRQCIHFTHKRRVLSWQSRSVCCKGNGKFMRHVKLRPGAATNAAALSRQTGSNRQGSACYMALPENFFQADAFFAPNTCRCATFLLKRGQLTAQTPDANSRSWQTWVQNTGSPSASSG